MRRKTERDEKCKKGRKGENLKSGKRSRTTTKRRRALKERRRTERSGVRIENDYEVGK